MSFRDKMKTVVHSYAPVLLPAIRRGIHYSSLIVDPKRRNFQMNLWRVKWLDWRRGTNFGDRMYWDEIGTTRERANDYSPSPLHIVRTLEKLGAGREDAIADLGCGKGYAMYLIAQFRPAMCGGVELSPTLARIAEENLRKIMPKDQVWCVYADDAGKWAHYDDYNIFYIYNSFPLAVVREVKERICESLHQRPRSCKVLYLMPEFPEVFAEDSRWHLLERDSEKELRHGMWIFENVR